jgi:NAD(P)-dependent dehydrogenase (short-subunit alcohol dehydrogenase family)
MLANRVALISGAAQGIGKATALTLAKEGAHVVAADIRTDGLFQTVNEVKALGRRGLAIPMDVSNRAQVEQCVQRAIREFKRIDILVNCAGISTSNLIIDIPEDEWDRVMDINAKGVFLLCQAVAREMITQDGPGGKIINISSQASKVGETGNGGYCASKAAVNMITQVLALELAPHRINVNAICPGYVDTDLMQEVFQKRGPIEGMTPKQYQEKLVAHVPLTRMARPEEVADLIAFLSSDKADYITGVAITIAGGKTLI